MSTQSKSKQRPISATHRLFLLNASALHSGDRCTVDGQLPPKQAEAGLSTLPRARDKAHFSFFDGFHPSGYAAGTKIGG